MCVCIYIYIYIYNTKIRYIHTNKHIERQKSGRKDTKMLTVICVVGEREEFCMIFILFSILSNISNNEKV